MWNQSLQLYLSKRRLLTSSSSSSTRVENRVKTDLKNEIIQCREFQLTLETHDTSMLCFSDAHKLWIENLNAELNKMAMEPKAKRIGFLFDSSDLLNVIKHCFANMKDAKQLPFHALLSDQFCLPSLNLPQLRKQFAELQPSLCQIGVEAPDDSAYAIHEVLGVKVAKYGDINLARYYLRQGVCPNLRSRLYKLIFEGRRLPMKTLPYVAHPLQQKTPRDPNQEVMQPMKSSEEAQQTLEISKQMRMSKVIELLNELDLRAVRNDNNYFVFESTLKHVLPELFNTHAKWLRVHLRGKQGWEENCLFPYSGLAMMMAPLAYVFQDKDDIIECFKHIYALYWSQLNMVANSDVSHLTFAPNLCAQFVTCLRLKCPRVLHKLMMLEIDPLDIAFPWIHTAFAGYLPVEQLLLLWDRIIGFDSLLILPLVAAAIFSYRADVIVEAASKEDILLLMSELENVNTIALLQEFLFL